MYTQRLVHRLFYGLCLAAALSTLAQGPLAAQDNAQATAPVETEQEAPVLLSPADGTMTTGTSDPPLGLPTLRWQGVEGAAKYRVQISTTPGGQPLVTAETAAIEYTLGVSQFGLGAKFPDGVYYWQVQAAKLQGFQTVWGPPSPTFRFIKDWSAGGMLRPALLMPPFDAVRAAFEPEDFSWSAVPGAATYLFEIAGDEGFTNIIYSSSTLATHHTPLTRLQSNRYFWRVTPMDYRGNRGAASEVRSFVFDWSAPPQLLAPGDQAQLPFVPRFSWTAVEGTRVYQLRISTQSDLSAATVYETANTDYTPVKALANDQDYFWQVRAVNQQGHTTNWSQPRSFRTTWNFIPKPLTPANNGIQYSYPFFSWQPIPGAERYQIQIDESNNFGGLLIADKMLYNVPSYTQPHYQNGLINQKYYWRVRGVDAQGNLTPWGATQAFSADFVVRPNYIYPPYYFLPDPTNLPVHRDRSIRYPLFIWDTAHTYDAFPVGNLGRVLPPDYYRLQVDDDPSFNSPNFSIETAGLGATPTTAHPFSSLADNTIYYWRVQAVPGPDEVPFYAWPMRYDAEALGLPFSPGATPVLMFPDDRFEATGTPPVLGWQPVVGAARYAVEISATPTFDSVVDSAEALFTYYVPYQGHTVPMPYGAYWWRVRALDNGGNPLGDWSTGRRFHLSVDLTTGNPYDMRPPNPGSLLSTTSDYLSELTLITPGGSGSGAYALGALHAATDRTYTGDQMWAIAFGVAGAIAETVRYVVYLDVDHIEGSGATTSPLDTNQPIGVAPLFRPEYALVVTRYAPGQDPPGLDPDGLDASEVTYWEWSGAGWNPPPTLQNRLGQAWYDAGSQAVQLLVPYTDIDPDITSGSIAIAVASAPAGSNQHQATIPAQGAIIDRPAWISDMLMPLFPFDTPLDNPFVYDELPPLRWRMPYLDSVDGYQVEVARDPAFTQRVELWETFEVNTSSFFELAPATFRSLNAFGDNESYYWRVRIRHERFVQSPADFFDYGPWSPPMRFKLTSLPARNLALNTGAAAFMTPTFTWDRVEGASGYTIQIDDDANFSSPLLNQATDATSYTPTESGFGSGTLLPGTQYYWRVAVRRSSTVIGQWSEPFTFTKSSLAPAPLSPQPDEVLQGQPRFTWAAVLTPTVEPRLAAPRYRLQVDDDPNFGSPKINVLVEMTAYTPRLTVSLGDGSWHWRVALVDANGNTGPYSTPRRFGIQHPLPETQSPTPGAGTAQIPTLAWTPVDGAAYYEVEVANNPFFNGSIKATTDNARYTPTQAFKTGVYYWRVQMFDADRNPGPVASGSFTFGHSVHLPAIRK